MYKLCINLYRATKACSRNWKSKIYQVCVDAFCPCKQFFCHVGMFSYHPWLNQYLVEDKVSCSRTQHSDSVESQTSNVNPLSNTLPMSLCNPQNNFTCIFPIFSFPQIAQKRSAWMEKIAARAKYSRLSLTQLCITQYYHLSRPDGPVPVFSPIYYCNSTTFISTTAKSIKLITLTKNWSR